MGIYQKFAFESRDIKDKPIKVSLLLVDTFI